MILRVPNIDKHFHIIPAAGRDALTSSADTATSGVNPCRDLYIKKIQRIFKRKSKDTIHTFRLIKHLT